MNFINAMVAVIQGGDKYMCSWYRQSDKYLAETKMRKEENEDILHSETTKPQINKTGTRSTPISSQKSSSKAHGTPKT